VRLDPAKGSHTMLTNFNAAAVADIDAPASIHFWFVAKNGKRIQQHNDPAAEVRSSQEISLGCLRMRPNSDVEDNLHDHAGTVTAYVAPATYYSERLTTGSTGFGEKFADDIEDDVLRGGPEILEAIGRGG